MTTGAMWGADAGALDQLGTTMGQSAQALRSIQTTIRAKLRSAPWEGNGADRFRAEWDAKHGKALLRAAGLMDEAARSLHAHATEQADASGAGTGAGRGPGLTPTQMPGGTGPVGPDGAKKELGLLGGLALGGQLALGTVLRALDISKYAKFVTSVAKQMPIGDIRAAWANFRGYSTQLDGFKLKLAQVFRLSDDALATAGRWSATWGRWGGPALTMVMGGVDLFTGGGDEGWHGVATRVAGGVGMVGGAALLASSAGLIALGPVGGVIAAGAVIGYGLYSLGNLIYNNREAIGSALSTAGNWVADQAGAVVDKGREIVDGVKDTITRAVTNPISLLPKLSVF